MLLIGQGPVRGSYRRQPGPRGKPGESGGATARAAFQRTGGA